MICEDDVNPLSLGVSRVFFEVSKELTVFLRGGRRRLKDSSSFTLSRWRRLFSWVYPESPDFFLELCSDSFLFLRELHSSLDFCTCCCTLSQRDCFLENLPLLSDTALEEDTITTSTIKLSSPKTWNQVFILPPRILSQSKLSCQKNRKNCCLLWRSKERWEHEYEDSMVGIR